jgi:hypothetical protein
MTDTAHKTPKKEKTTEAPKDTKEKVMNQLLLINEKINQHLISKTTKTNNTVPPIQQQVNKIGQDIAEIEPQNSSIS